MSQGFEWAVSLVAVGLVLGLLWQWGRPVLGWLGGRVPPPLRIILALVVGLLLGILLANQAPDAGAFMLLFTKRIGGAWLHGLQMVIVPLVVALLVIGIAASAEAARAGKIAARALIAFVVILWVNTLLSAFLTPLLLKLFPLPAEWGDALRASLSGAKAAGQIPSLGDFFDKIVPTNIVDAAATDSFLPLTVFAMVFAFAITRLEAGRRKTLIDFFQAIADAMVVVIGWVLVLAPLGVFCLAFGLGMETGAAAFGALAHYIAIVSTMGILVLLSAYPLAAIGARVGVGRFARAVLPSQVVAISTSSSLASLPAMLRSSEGLGAPASVSGVVLPIAVAVFRATSPAMNLAVALYVAHLTGTTIGPGQLAAGIATAAITTMGSVSLPGTISFFASVAPVAVAMGVPIEALGLLVAVETVPDLFRTVGNVTMDVAVTATISARSGGGPDGETDRALEEIPRMKYRTLGTHDGGLKVSAIGIGCMPMIREGNINYGHADDDESIRTIHEAIDLGVTFFDTAEMYGPFSNEELVGQAIKGKRDGLVIATKFAMRWNGNDMAGLDGSPENARRACEGSLKRLGIDTIDLFYQHRVDPNVPIEETVGGMAKLVEEGKVRHIALSEAGTETIRRAAKVHPITALQSEYSIWERDVEGDILDACRENGVGFVPYSPLGRGFLAGTIRSLDDLPADDWRHNDPRYQADTLPQNLKIVDAIAAVAARHDASNAQVALAWLLAQGDDVVPIPGVKRRVTMRDSAAAPDVTLTDADLATIDAAAPNGGTAGPRYSERGMRMVKL